MPDYSTCSWYNFSKVSVGSSQRPGCTLEVCTTVLRVAVSHRKREGISSCAMAPPSLLPRHIWANECRCDFNSAISILLENEQSLSSSTAHIHCKNFSLGQYKITPTLRNSSRSTCGITRMTAYSNKLFADMLCFVYKNSGCRYPGV